MSTLSPPDTLLLGWRQEIEVALTRVLEDPTGPAATVGHAMRHAVLGGGKRLRPLLSLAVCRACGGRTADVLLPAAALELVHAYSLVHDDLPAMDDDALRRGRPTVHVAFGEAAAILAGDALLTLAFELLATHPTGEAAAPRRAEAVRTVARAAGASGMVGGQQADLEAERLAPEELPAGHLRWIHTHKTGALLGAAAELGALHAGWDAPHREPLARFGQALGLAFQIADDILDATASRETLGKTPGKDARSGKATYPLLFGLAESRRLAEEQMEAALAELRAAGVADDDGVLASLTRGAVRRQA
jgi:geranylgeranyl pyrophosphate synthase